MSDAPSPSPSPIWCVVANVAQLTRHGPGGREVQRGLRHFSPGTKVYCYPPLWGDGYENVRALGRHRGTPGGLVELVVPSRHLTDWRAKLVYAPFVIARMGPYTDGSASARERAEALVQGCRALAACPLCAAYYAALDAGHAWPLASGTHVAMLDAQGVRVAKRQHGSERSEHAREALHESALRLAALLAPEPPAVQRARAEEGHLVCALSFPAGELDRTLAERLERACAATRDA